MRRTLSLVATLVWAILAAGCALVGNVILPSGHPIKVAPYELPAPTSFSPVFRAGVGKADITPPAGYPTGGHGPAGSLALGNWTRLHARAFFFADPQGHTAVFVSCDLFAILGGLVAEVAREVGTKWGPSGGHDRARRHHARGHTHSPVARQFHDGADLQLVRIEVQRLQS